MSKQSWKTYKDAKLFAYRSALAEGKVDRRITKLLGAINANPDLVTLSSCSGRINLLVYDLEKGKGESSFFAKWHEPVRHDEFEMKLSAYTGKLPLWFKCEPFILHVAASDVKSADAFVRKVRAEGVKRGGIQVVGKERVLTEVQGNGQLIFPIDLVEAEWDKVIDFANEMLRRNLEQVRRLEKVEW